VNLNLRQSPNTSSKALCGVTELILTDRSQAQLQLVLPMICYLTNVQEERWVTWITDRAIDKKALMEMGVNTKVFRILTCANKTDLLWVTWEALSSGTSHTVITEAGRLSETEIAQLEHAAEIGQSQGLILRHR
jgi:cell division inhibitor SulA